MPEVGSYGIGDGIGERQTATQGQADITRRAKGKTDEDRKNHFLTLRLTRHEIELGRLASEYAEESMSAIGASAAVDRFYEIIRFHNREAEQSGKDSKRPE